MLLRGKFLLTARIHFYFLLCVDLSECNSKIGSAKKSKDAEEDQRCKILCSLLCHAQKIREFHICIPHQKPEGLIAAFQLIVGLYVS